jgi:uncharacterized membrane protein
MQGLMDRKPIPFVSPPRRSYSGKLGKIKVPFQHPSMIKAVWKWFFAGLVVVVPTWSTFLILSTLFTTLDSIIGSHITQQIPGLGLLLLISLLIGAGLIADHLIGERLLRRLEKRLEQIPVVQSIYLTLKGMTDVLNFRSRFGRSTIVAFPFPRDGLWALGFVMGDAPAVIQVEPTGKLIMVFVPTAIHPFTGFLAFIPEHALKPINLLPEDAMKMEFSAGFYKPRAGWLSMPTSTR